MFPRINSCVVVALILASSEAVTVTKSLCVGGENVTINANVILDECEDSVTEPECLGDFVPKCRELRGLFCPADGRCYISQTGPQTFEKAASLCASDASSFQTAELPSIEDLENKITLSCASKALHVGYVDAESKYWHKGSYSPPTNCSGFNFDTDFGDTVMIEGVNLDEDPSYCEAGKKLRFFCILTP